MVLFTIIFIGCVMVPVLLSAFIAFDVLIRRMYRDHRDQWESLGRPHGMMWHATETNRFSFKSDFARKKLQFTWLFRTPEWVKCDISATRWIWWLRFAVFFWNAGIIGVFIAWKLLIV